MDKKSNTYVVLFAVTTCAICAVALAAAYNGFRDRISINEQFDLQKNVLIALDLYERGDPVSSEELRRLFAERVEATVLEVQRGTVEEIVMQDGERSTVQVERVVDMVPTEYSVEELAGLRREEARKPNPEERREFAPIYRALGPDGGTEGWAIPISGYGLWSTLYGFLALEPDLNTVKGITFYRHAETPGLGGEVDNPAWQAQWEGKKILDESGELVSVRLKKGKVDPAIEREREHMVDGLSGATITGNGVTKFVKSDLQRYAPYFEKQRKS